MYRNTKLFGAVVLACAGCSGSPDNTAEQNLPGATDSDGGSRLEVQSSWVQTIQTPYGDIDVVGNYYHYRGIWILQTVRLLTKLGYITGSTWFSVYSDEYWTRTNWDAGQHSTAYWEGLGGPVTGNPGIGAWTSPTESFSTSIAYIAAVSTGSNPVSVHVTWNSVAHAFEGAETVQLPLWFE
jgi:hypothetical protein